MKHSFFGTENLMEQNIQWNYSDRQTKNLRSFFLKIESKTSENLILGGFYIIYFQQYGYD